MRWTFVPGGPRLCPRWHGWVLAHNGITLHVGGPTCYANTPTTTTTIIAIASHRSAPTARDNAAAMSHVRAICIVLVGWHHAGSAAQINQIGGKPQIFFSSFALKSTAIDSSRSAGFESAFLFSLAHQLPREFRLHRFQAGAGRWIQGDFHGFWGAL